MESVLSARNSLGFWKARGVALGGVALVVGGRLSALLAEWRREWAALGGDRGWLDLVRVGCVAEGDALRAEGLLAVPGMDRLSWDAERVRLTLARGDEATVLARLAVRADWIGVGAERGGWSLRLLARVAAPGAVLEAEGLNAGEVGELRRCGFEIESELGGRIRGRFRVERERTRERTPGGDDCRGGELGRAVVVGGGLAGTSVVRALGRRGWAVTLVERHGGVAQEASGNRAGVLAPMMSRDDGRAARLSRACFGWLLRELRGLEARGAAVAWGDCGVLQIAKNAREQAAMEAVAADGGWDPEYVRVLSASEVGRRLGGRFDASAYWFERGGWVDPASLCAAWLETGGAVERRFFREALECEEAGGEWEVREAGGRVLGRAPVVVLANAMEALRLLPEGALRFKRVRGQVSHLREGAFPGLSCVVCRDGYLTPAVDGMHCVGATYDFDRVDADLDAPGHGLNVARLAGLLGRAVEEERLRSELEDAGAQGGRVGFRCLTPDRMPVAGRLPMGRGVVGLLGLGSRGLVWSGLLGELVASGIEGRPPPVERDLVEAVGAERFGAAGF